MDLSQISYHPSMGGAAIAAFMVILLAVFVVNKRHSFAILFEQAYEGMLDFFADILGEKEHYWIKAFVTNMFFVILLYNLLGLIFDQVAAVFGYNEQKEAYLGERLSFATADYHFNIAMAIIGVLITLGVQFLVMDGDGFIGKKISDKKWNTPFFKFFNFIYEYVPFWGKDIITIEKGSMNPLLYYPLFVVIKVFDVVISMFVGFLDIVGILAKVISLAFRLFGNMISGTALFATMMIGLGAATEGLLGFSLPVLAPIILVAQGLLVACIQAFVFPLLIAIFIKVARMGSDEEATA